MKRGITVVPDRVALKQARQEALLTQAQLAVKANTTAIQVYRIETGRQNTSINMLRRLAVALEISDFRELIDLEASFNDEEQL